MSARNTGAAVRIALDAMGGDYAPEEVVKGAVMAATEDGVEMNLVGPLPLLERELAKYNTHSLPIHCTQADEFIAEGEHPALALRRKPNASIAVAMKLVKSGRADAAVGAGSTGAVMVSALQILGTVKGVERPVAGGPFLGFAPNTVVLDMGANVDCKPYHFLNFAIIGSVFARTYLSIPNPTVALLSTGAEEGKGGQVVVEAYALLKKSGLNFIGNVEGIDIPLGKANVVVCDGLTGNVMVKFSEGLARAVGGWLENKLKGRLSPEEIKALTAELRTLSSLAEGRGGGPLLGTNGIAVVAHGRSRAPEIKAAILEAKRAVELDFLGALNAELAKIAPSLD